MAVSRREFLYSSSSVAAAAFMGWPARMLAQPSSKQFPVIDPHTHIFNAADIPIVGFSNTVIPQSLKKLGWLGRAIGALAGMIGRVTREVAPGYGAELERLNSWLASSSFKQAADWKITDENAINYYHQLIVEYEELDPGVRTDLEEEFRKDGERGLYELEEAIDEGDEEKEMEGRDLAGVHKDFLNQEAPFLAFLEASKNEEAALLSGTQLNSKDKAVLAGFNWIPGARLVRQFKHFSQFRFKNAVDLMMLFPQVDAFVTASVDFDFWLGSDRARTTTGEQIDLMSKISLLTNGKILGMVGFNPWSSLVEPKRFTAIREGVMDKGMVGVKLYPPMGFRPWNNAAFDNDASKWPSNWPLGTFGSDIDQQLSALYRFCSDEKVTVMAHANDSNEAAPDYGERADPVFWHQALNNFQELHFSTGHSGGFDEVVNNAAWFNRALQVADDFQHSYLDFAHFGEIYKRKNRRKMADGLKLHARLSRKFMYGSDWYMLASQKKFEKYFSNFEDVVRRAGLAHDIMGLNAANYLGLNNGHATRQRLDRFFPGKNTANKLGWFNKLP